MNEAEALRARLVRNIHEQPLQTSDRAPHYDGGRSARLFDDADRKIGCGYDEVPPGKRSCPYHFHYAQEEVFVILSGEGTLRVAGEHVPVRAGDVIRILPGPAYPHQLLNTSDAMLTYLSLSTREYPEICEYPDSQKYGAFAAPADGPLLHGGRMHRAKDDLDYWDGEP
jgi:uncharacterized cupin superfamily protein